MTSPIALLAPATRPVLVRLLPPLPDAADAQPPLPFLDESPGPQWPDAPGRSPHERVVRAVVVALVEVMAGRRPPTQARPIVSRRVGALVDHVTRSRLAHGLTVATFRLQEPRDGVAEITLRLTDGERSRPLALRLEGRGRRWRCTALEGGIAEDAHRPFRDSP
ncbi:MAG: Rv3235 family protein [Propionibacteriaceae bacterium]|nr:Rv3235 family protein [Propionibacteriaceae bacterium]